MHSLTPAPSPLHFVLPPTPMDPFFPSSPTPCRPFSTAQPRCRASRAYFVPFSGLFSQKAKESHKPKMSPCKDGMGPRNPISSINMQSRPATLPLCSPLVCWFPLGNSPGFGPVSNLTQNQNSLYNVTGESNCDVGSYHNRSSICVIGDEK
jgi:hypothetical protein